MATNDPTNNVTENDDLAERAAQGRQAGSPVGQSSGKPSYGVGGYELNLDAEAGDEGGSGSATSANERTSRGRSQDSDTEDDAK
ncbi:hypothetical protein HNQ93_003626 [Hymenobacter luteus]|uniref:Uncharacterized protein n=2 Tax=Hymenobacter TaxID=89966 RepID=A0A7W9T375_9BACT|nr:MULTISPECIES: hypothetical protein [Hymenobacter]MBB4602859.1 hypothetical protein [Hymenobacter latericoloratus]MBB6060751.1 hypothetical protein [Hymenobacter luteus]